MKKPPIIAATLFGFLSAASLSSAEPEESAPAAVNYHVGAAGSNQIIGGFHGVPGSMQVGDKKPSEEAGNRHPHPEGHGPPPGERPDGLAPGK